LTRPVRWRQAAASAARTGGWPLSFESDRITSPEWQRILEQGAHFWHQRRCYRILPTAPRCELCNAPFAGIGGAALRLTRGLRPSTLNPRFCNDCELIAARYPGGAETDVAMLFVDIRGSTSLAEDMTPSAFTAVIDRFYQAATDVLIDAGAMIEKLMGDEVTAIFVRGFAGPRYVRRAIEAGQQLLRVGGESRAGGIGVPVGIGVHAGRAYVGAIGRAGRMVTISALGDTVNVAARLAAAAGPGEMLVSDDACRAAGVHRDAHAQRELALKGRSVPVTVRVWTRGAHA
jgi:adenylate cyclase